MQLFLSNYHYFLLILGLAFTTVGLILFLLDPRPKKSETSKEGFLYTVDRAGNFEVSKDQAIEALKKSLKETEDAMNNPRPKNSGQAFKRGDTVTAYGNIGTVKNISPNGMFVVVVFPDCKNGDLLFHPDGKAQTWHKEAVLKKV